VPGGVGLPLIVDGSGLSATFGQKEVADIHLENMEKISHLSADEIREEREKLLQELGRLQETACVAGL